MDPELNDMRLEDLKQAMQGLPFKVRAVNVEQPVYHVEHTDGTILGVIMLSGETGRWHHVYIGSIPGLALDSHGMEDMRASLASLVNCFIDDRINGRA